MSESSKVTEDLFCWNVIYTRSRAEKKTAQLLLDNGITAYCPVNEEIRQWSDRKKKVLKPLLPSMVLVREDSFKDDELFRHSGVVGFMSYKGERARVSQKEVNILEEFIRGNYTMKKNTIDIGDQIEVPVLKKVGKLVKIKGNACWVQLANTGISVSFSIRNEKTL